MCYLLTVLAATGITLVFCVYASLEAASRGLAPVPVLTGNPTSVRERLGYEPWIETSTAETSAYTTRIRGTAQNIITAVKCRFATAARERGNRRCQGNAKYRRNPIARNVTTALHAADQACKSTEIKSQTARAVTALARSSFWLQADTPAVTSKWMPPATGHYCEDCGITIGYPGNAPTV